MRTSTLVSIQFMPTVTSNVCFGLKHFWYIFLLGKKLNLSHFHKIPKACIFCTPITFLYEVFATLPGKEMRTLKFNKVQ